MNVEKVFLDQIAELEKQIETLESALHAVRESKSKLGDPKMKFFDWRPLDAARKLLREHGGKMRRATLVEMMIDGGITHGKKRGKANIRISLERNIENDNLIQKGDWIELPV